MILEENRNKKLENNTNKKLQKFKFAVLIYINNQDDLLAETKLIY